MIQEESRNQPSTRLSVVWTRSPVALRVHPAASRVTPFLLSGAASPLAAILFLRFLFH